ncbi:hypothetical protein [Longimicrobium sp.]|uniref:hypothetical protein n=1 Tax=Longimicrobium sp. TaxID=2029185 RepID=UPI002E363A58|nr:hypothetical protein [Longimicrobium sp.]HEX6039689.1 hypothetical protein [Longimicrobium sp.]
MQYAPLPPRPAPPPERPWWRTVGGWLGAAGWVVVLAGLFFLCRGIYLQYRGADQRALQAAEVKREKEHARKVFVWVQDTLATTLVKGSAGRPAPTTEPAKRVWAVGRMLADRWTWERQILQRHGATAHNPPAAMETVDYQANARAHPAVGRYLESRAAAIAEIEKGSAAWVEEHMAALAREAGMPVEDVRGLFPPEFGSAAADAAPHADALLAFHRHLVRVDPWVRPGGGDDLLWQREDEAHRSSELAARVNAAAVQSARAREQRVLRERAAFSGLLQ